MTAQKRQLSTQAQVAKIARQFVKSLGLEVSARSESFAGGDAVDVTVTNATGEQRDIIDKELKQYQYGSFNGMDDIYEYTNSRDDIPQTKYLHINYIYCEEYQQAAFVWAKQHAIATHEAEQMPELYKDADSNTRTERDFLSSIIHRVLNGIETRWVEETESYVSFWHDFKPATPPSTPAPQGGKPNIEGAQVHEIMHTKKQVNIYIVTMRSLEREEFNEVRDYVKSIGGWYSRKFGSSPAGFAFNTREEAEAFANKAEDQPNSNELSTNTAHNDKQAEKLTTIAEKARAQAADKLATRETNTPKRLAQAMHARVDGQRLERMAIVADKLAAFWSAGTITDHLAQYKSKKALHDALGAELEPVANGFHAYHIDTGRPAERADIELWNLLDSCQTDNKLLKLENAVKFTDIPGYFPTPPAVQQLMLDQVTSVLKEVKRPHILEPSAGNGALCEAAIKQWPHASITAVEQNATLCELVNAHGFECLQDDFMNVEPDGDEMGVFDLVLMNPPFEKLQDMAHIQRAFEWLNSTGQLVAIASAGVAFRNDNKTTAFREWLDTVGGTIERLPEGSFKESGTMVNTVLINIHKF